MLTWDAPPVTGGSDITAYKIQRSKTGISGWTDLKTLTLIDDDLSNPSAGSYGYTDKKLMAGATWHYRVIAINAVGESDPSNTDSASTVEGDEPVAPTQLRAQGNDSQVTLYWQAPADQPGAPVTGYKIERKKVSADDWSLVQVNTRSKTTSYGAGRAVHTVDNPGTNDDETDRWIYQITAINAKGPGAASSPPLDLNGDTLPKATHGAVKSLSAKAASRTSIALTWDLPAGGTGDTTYRVFASKDGRAWTFSAPTTDSGKDEFYNHTGLKTNERWYYLVFATTGSDNHKVSSRVTARTASAVVPDKVEFLSANLDSSKPGSQINLMIGLEDDSTASYSNGGADVTGFQIRRSTNQITWETIAANFDGDDDPTPPQTGEPRRYDYYDKKLSAGVTYHYEVRAINSAGVSPLERTQATTTGAVALGAPAGLVAVARTGAEVDLYWNSPGDPDGDPIIGYWIEVSEDSGTTWSNVASDTMSRATTHTHKGAPLRQDIVLPGVRDQLRWLGYIVHQRGSDDAGARGAGRADGHGHRGQPHAD